jgi:hypothetical protein
VVGAGDRIRSGTDPNYGAGITDGDDADSTEAATMGVWDYCAQSEKHPRSGLETLKTSQNDLVWILRRLKPVPYPIRYALPAIPTPLTTLSRGKAILPQAHLFKMIVTVHSFQTDREGSRERL